MHDEQHEYTSPAPEEYRSPAPGEKMPKGAPIRRRSDDYDRLVSIYRERELAARAAPPGVKRVRSLEASRVNRIAIGAMNRHERRKAAKGIGSEAADHAYKTGRAGVVSAPLRAEQVRTLLSVQRYARMEALEKIDGPGSVVTLEGSFPVYRNGKCAGHESTFRIHVGKKEETVQ